MFFILHGKIYSAPSLFDILDTRLVSISSPRVIRA